MKTIAITLDEETLRLMARLLPNGRFRSRSELVRHALRDFLEEESRHSRERRERDILRRQRDRLDREARALLREQARP